jgi:drug/metabolite transporter (DMT)-like permease
MLWFALALSSALLSAAAAVMQKQTLYRLSALEFSFLVSIIILVLSSFVPLTADVTSLPASTMMIVIGKSIIGGIAFLLVMTALERNQISTALPLLGLTPAAAALLSLLAAGESLQPWEWAGIGMMTAGTYIVEKRPAQAFWAPFREAFASRSRLSIVGALVLFACSSVLDKTLVSGYRTPPLVVLFYQHIVYCGLFGVFLLARRASFPALARKGIGQLPLLAAVALVSLAYRFTQLEATKLAPVALVLAVKRTSILYASFYGGRIFSEERLTLKLLGGALIVGGGFVILRNVG